MNDLNWDKTKEYVSPSGEQISKYENGKWVIYIRQDVVKDFFNQLLDQEKKKEAIAFLKLVDDELYTRTGEDDYENNDGDCKNREQLYNLYKSKI